MGTLRRQRLLPLLDGGANVVLVHAPGGFGKTTLLRDWVEASSAEVVWVSLPRQARGCHDFWNALLDSVVLLGHVGPDSAQHLREVVATGEGHERALVHLFTEHPDLTLAVDRFESVVEDCDELWRQILEIAERQPRSRFVLATRSLRDSTERLLLRPMVAGIDAASLAMTLEEVTELVRAEHPDAPHRLAGQIWVETDGHPLSVRAALLGLDRSGTGGVPRWRGAVHRDLLRELDASGVVELVVALRVAPFFDVALASELSGWPAERVGTAVAYLENHGFGSWEEFRGGDTAFRLSHTVTEAVTEELRPPPPDRVSATSTAAWLEERSQHVEALHCAIGAELYDSAASILRRSLLNGPHLASITELEPLLREIPVEVIKDHPYLSLARGIGLLSHPVTRPAAAGFMQPMADADLSSGPELPREEQVVALTAKSIALRLQHRFAEAGRTAGEAAALLDPSGFDGLSNPVVGTAIACHLSHSLFQAGDQAAASRLVADRVSVAAGSSARRVATSYGLAWAALDGRLDQARSMAILMAESSATRARRTLSHPETIGVAAVLLDEFDFAAALGVVEQRRRGQFPEHMWPQMHWVELNARLGLGEAVQDLHRISDAMEAASPPPGVGQSLCSAALSNTLAIGWLAADNLVRANRAIDSVVDFPGQVAPAVVLREMTGPSPADTLRMVPALRGAAGHTVRSRAELETVGAAAALRAGAPRLAITMLGLASGLYVEHGVRAHLAHLPHEDLVALRALAQEEGDERSVRFLTVLPPAPLPQPSERIVLTPREHEVLRALMEHTTRTDMAAALYVSPNTVKTQLRSVYRKLGVTDRTEAIQRAIELDLLISGDDE